MWVFDLGHFGKSLEMSSGSKTFSERIEISYRLYENRLNVLEKMFKRLQWGSAECSASRGRRGLDSGTRIEVQASWSRPKKSRGWTRTLKTPSGKEASESVIPAPDTLCNWCCSGRVTAVKAARTSSASLAFVPYCYVLAAGCCFMSGCTPCQSCVRNIIKYIYI